MIDSIEVSAEFSNTETAVKKLAEVIVSTRTRVNSLEYAIIPRMLSIIRHIEAHLKEAERWRVSRAE